MLTQARIGDGVRRFAGRVVTLGVIILIGCSPPDRAGDAPDEDEVELIAFVGDLAGQLSGPAGDRDWERISGRFLPDAQLFGLRPGDAGALPQARAQSFDEWKVGAEEYFRQAPLYERQVEAKASVAGPLGHVLSVYESRHHPDSVPYQRGLNSVLLVRTPDGWRISVMFHAELPLAGDL